jgi:hypothetical protein
MHQKKIMHWLHILKIDKNIIIYYSRIKKFDKEKNTLKSKNIYN